MTSLAPYLHWAHQAKMHAQNAVIQDLNGLHTERNHSATAAQQALDMARNLCRDSGDTAAVNLIMQDVLPRWHKWAETETV